MGNSLTSIPSSTIESSQNSSESFEEALNYSKSKIDPDATALWDKKLLNLSVNTSVFIKSKNKGSKHDFPNVSSKNVFQNSFIHNFVCFAGFQVVHVLNLNDFVLKKFEFPKEIQFNQCVLSFDELWLILYSSTEVNSDIFVFEFQNLFEDKINEYPIYILNCKRVSRIMGLGKKLFIISEDGSINQFDGKNSKNIFQLPHCINDEIFKASFNQEIIYLDTGLFSFYFADLIRCQIIDHKLNGLTQISNNHQFILNCHQTEIVLFNYNFDRVLFKESIPFDILFSLFDYDSMFIICVVQDFILFYSIESKSLIFSILTSTKDIQHIFVSQSNDLFLLKNDGEFFKFEIVKLHTKINMKKNIEGKLTDLQFKFL
jgi:hypothetical protein